MIFLVSFLAACFVLASDPVALPCRQVLTLNQQAEHSCIDAFGTIYWLDHDGLNRLPSATQRPQHYSNHRFGPITHLDVSDPLHLLVFYGHSGMIEFLDKHLAPKEMPGLSPGWPGNNPPSLVSASAQQGLWAFFPHTMSLKRFDARMVLQAENNNLQQQLPDFSLPVYMVESNNRIFVATDNHHLFVFDSFCNFLFSLKSRGTDRFQVVGNHLVTFKNDKMHVFNFIRSSETVYLLPEQDIRQGFVRGKYLLLQTRNHISKYLLPANLL